MKYKQKIVPEICILNVKAKELVKLMQEYYKKNLQGKTIVNKHL